MSLLPVSRQQHADRRRSTSQWLTYPGLLWLGPVAALATGLALQSGAVLNSDTSWILTLVEKMLGGERFGVDFVEVNPPFTIWLYVPFVVVAHAVGVAPETIVMLGMPVLAVASVWMSMRMLGPLHLMKDGPASLMVSAALLTIGILPGSTFAQRDHIAAIVILPWLAAAVLRAYGRAPRRSGVVAAALGAAITLCVKPHFIIVLVAVAMGVAVHRRNWKFLFTREAMAGGALALLIAATSVGLHPHYWSDTVPLVRDMYVGGIDWRAGLSQPMISIWLLVSAATFATAGRAVRKPEYWITFIASSAFVCVFLLQGKFFAYHSLPFLILSFVLAAYAVVQALLASQGVRSIADYLKPAIAFCALVVTFPTLAFGHFAAPGDWSALAQAVEQVGHKPTILNVSVDLGVGHPVTRMVQGRWVGRYPSLWVALSAAHQRVQGASGARLETIDAYEREYIEGLRKDLMDGRPDILLADRFGGFDALAYLRRDAGIAAALEGYELAKVVTVSRAGEEAEIWKRKDLQK